MSKRINSFYLLIAGLVLAKVGSAEATDFNVTFATPTGICANDYSLGDGDAACYICLPRSTTDGSAEDQLDGLYESGEMYRDCEGKGCVIDPNDIYLQRTYTGPGGRSIAGSNGIWSYPAYECTTSGWQEIDEGGGEDPTPQDCPDVSAYGAIFYDCCNGEDYGGFYMCWDGYSSAGCTSGWYGDGNFDGTMGWCDQCPAASGTDYYGDEIPVMTDAGHRDAKTDCYIGGSTTFGDATGMFVYVQNCYWKN